MKRELLNKNKRKYSRLIKQARTEDIGLHNLLQVLAGLQEIKQYRRISKRYGTTEDWGSAEFSTTMITVPIVSRKDNKIESYAAYFSVEMLPIEKREQYTSFFVKSSPAEGSPLNSATDDCQTDEGSRDSSINIKGEL
jgi:hypothetical protein